MVDQQQIRYSNDEKALYKPHEYLNIAIKSCNITVLPFTTKPDLSKRSIMRDCAGNGEQMNTATRKLANPDMYNAIVASSTQRQT
jgi:hypothetical protein